MWPLGIIFLVLVVLWFAAGGAMGPRAQYGELLDNPLTPEQEPNYRFPWSDNSYQTDYSGAAGADNSVAGYYPSTAPSAYASNFLLDQGSAAYERRPGAEYITLTYQGQAPVDITGWYLVNGNSQRLYEEGGRLVYGNPGVAAIPGVVNTLALGATSLPQSDLVLHNGDTVVITTGAPPVNSGELRAAKNGFRLNICSGYLTESGDYNFVPGLWSSCPAPAEWPGSRGLDEECYDFVSNSVGACHTPEFKRDREDNRTIDGAPDELSNRCRDFIQETFTYNGCVANFLARPDFYTGEWRVFLNRTWELWADQRETISLYDRNNQLVTQLKY